MVPNVEGPKSLLDKRQHQSFVAAAEYCTLQEFWDIHLRVSVDSRSIVQVWSKHIKHRLSWASPESHGERSWSSRNCSVSLCEVGECLLCNVAVAGRLWASAFPGRCSDSEEVGRPPKAATRERGPAVSGRVLYWKRGGCAPRGSCTRRCGGLCDRTGLFRCDMADCRFDGVHPKTLVEIWLNA